MAAPGAVWWPVPLHADAGAVLSKLLVCSEGQFNSKMVNELDRLRRGIAGETDARKCYDFSCSYISPLTVAANRCTAQGVSGAVRLDAQALADVGGFCWASSPLLKPIGAGDEWDSQNGRPSDLFETELCMAAMTNAILGFGTAARDMLVRSYIPGGSLFVQNCENAMNHAARAFAAVLETYRLPLAVTARLPETSRSAALALHEACTAMIYFERVIRVNIKEMGVLSTPYRADQTSASDATSAEKRAQRIVLHQLCRDCTVSQALYAAAAMHLENLGAKTPLLDMMQFFRQASTALYYRSAGVLFARVALQSSKMEQEVRVDLLKAALRSLTVYFAFATECARIVASADSACWKAFVGVETVATLLGDMVDEAWKEEAKNEIIGRIGHFELLTDDFTVKHSDQITLLSLAPTMQHLSEKMVYLCNLKQV